ncbi:L-threonylcarbamoyladenylate synthase [Lysinibacillus piscis]|uniref:Threonylcarbamoyl-AMP synthase n=1 Tax=Lysinibacillus piscis TaxID=2518931 RepID=A0ABQ5NIQ5_9BACI|nr:L-threonylcarbamoyladenylate synthase [Lysinibacillus sp. KH24]GLC87936.1 threonylcarbamoyl-AMP synthase [Lysinibacillus sp. KH24]
MKTVCKVVENNVNSQTNYAQAVDILNSGGLVAFPTETVYGLGAIATDDNAVKNIFKAKGRPADNPLIVHIGTKGEVALYIDDIPEVAKTCMAVFWPGPLTLIMSAKPNILASSVTAGLETVGIRMPDHPVALALLQQLKKPLAAPSANRSGKPSPTEAVHVQEDLDGYIPYILDGGATGIGLESTVLDVTHEPPVILRPGGITKEMLEEVIGPVLQPTQAEQKLESTPKAPGMKYTHYAPNAPVMLIDCDWQKVSLAIDELQAQSEKIALLAPNSFMMSKADFFFSLGEENCQEDMGIALYQALRACDQTEATVILVTATSTDGVGAAIMNRLEKASGGNWYITK